MALVIHAFVEDTDDINAVRNDAVEQDVEV